MASILLVDDDETVALTLRAALEQEGHQVEYASGAKDATAKIESGAFEAAILDLSLQDGDGLDLLKLLKGTSPATVAIILTGYGSLESAIRAVRAGAFDYLIKPSDLTELRDALDRGLEWQRTAGQVARLGTLTADLERLVADRDRLLRAARRHAVDVRKLDELKEELILVASHELKGPLTSIRGFAQMLRRRVAAPDPDLGLLDEGLALIDAQAAGMAALLDGLLDASRVETGALDIRAAPCDLAACLNSVLASLSPEERGRVEVRLPAEPVVGMWDETRIGQVLANLVGNGLKYGAPSGRVSVVLEQRVGEIEVAITDLGIGVPPEEMEHLFKRFYRTPQAKASGLPGTGLGLYICRGIVEAHGGRIWAESPGAQEGATFRFTLPLPPPESRAAAVPAGEPAVANQSGGVGRPI